MGIVSGAVTGNYEVMGGPASCIVGQSFGARTEGDGLVNIQLASYAANQAMEKGLPLILQGEIADALPSDSPEPVCVIRGKPSSKAGGQLDSFEVLRKARACMVRQGIELFPMIVAQAHHVGRVAVQARKFGMEPVIPPGLPTIFDTESTQYWTRSRGLWVLRELPGMVVLKATSKL